MPQVEPKLVQSVAERSSKILADFTQKQAQSLSSAVRDEMGIAKAYMDLYAKLAADPALVASLSVNLWIDYLQLWQSTWMKMLGVPYNDVEVANADINAEKQAEKVYEGLLSQDPSLESVKDTEVIALIAYLQSLGKKTSQQGVASSSR